MKNIKQDKNWEIEFDEKFEIMRWGDVKNFISELLSKERQKTIEEIKALNVGTSGGSIIIPLKKWKELTEKIKNKLK